MRKIWSGIKELISLKSKTRNPISLSIGNTVSSDPETVANTFNDFFTHIADKADKVDFFTHVDDKPIVK